MAPPLEVTCMNTMRLESTIIQQKTEDLYKDLSNFSDLEQIQKIVATTNDRFCNLFHTAHWLHGCWPL